VEGIFSVGNCFLLRMAKVFALDAVRLEVCLYMEVEEKVDV
jgi:hypothetical protein